MIRVGPPRRTLLLVWCGVGLFFGTLLGLAQASEGPLDDPDPAFQRPGFLDVGPLPEPAPPIDDIEFSDHRSVIYFERTDRVGRLCDALAETSFAPDVQSVIVIDGPAPAGTIDGCPTDLVVNDREFADRYGIRSTRDGGPPVGYAIVDAAGQIRYRTLDPAVIFLLDEVRTILGALP